MTCPLGFTLLDVALSIGVLTSLVVLMMLARRISDLKVIKQVYLSESVTANTPLEQVKPTGDPDVLISYLDNLVKAFKELDKNSDNGQVILYTRKIRAEQLRITQKFNVNVPTMISAIRLIAELES